MAKLIDKIRNAKFKGSWLDRFTCAFLSTVLGITITLGVGMYRQNKEKEEFVYKNEVLAMHSIYEKIGIMKGQFTQLNERQKAIALVADKYPDSLSVLTYDDFDGLIISLSQINYDENDKYAAQVFNSNSDVWVKAKSLTEVASINKLFAIMDVCQETISDINNVFASIRDKSMPVAFTKDNILEAVKYILDDPYNRYYIDKQIPLQLEIAEASINTLQDCYEGELKRLGISQEEINACSSEIECERVDIRH